MGPEHASREKKLTMVNFLIFLQINIYVKGFQKMKIRPLKGFEKIRFFVFLHYRGILAQNIPKSDFRGPKIPPRRASST